MILNQCFTDQTSLSSEKFFQLFPSHQKLFNLLQKFFLIVASKAKVVAFERNWLRWCRSKVRSQSRGERERLSATQPRLFELAQSCWTHRHCTRAIQLHLPLQKHMLEHFASSWGLGSSLARWFLSRWHSRPGWEKSWGLLRSRLLFSFRKIVFPSDLFFASEYLKWLGHVRAVTSPMKLYE